MTAPTTTRTTQGFDVRWRDILDGGSPIDAVHYEVRNAAGGAVVPPQTIRGNTPQAIANLEAPRAGLLHAAPVALRCRGQCRGAGQRASFL